jgi:hypothetical protein
MKPVTASKLARFLIWLDNNKLECWLRARPRLKWTLLVLIVIALVWAIATPPDKMAHLFGL